MKGRTRLGAAFFFKVFGEAVASPTFLLQSSWIHWKTQLPVLAMQSSLGVSMNTNAFCWHPREAPIRS